MKFGVKLAAVLQALLAPVFQSPLTKKAVPLLHREEGLIVVSVV